MGKNGVKECAQGATEYTLILAAVLLVVAVAIYYVTRPPGFPILSATEAKQDNEIRINVETGSIPAGDWQYSVSSTLGSYNWIDGNVELKAPYATLGTYNTGNWYVSLRHKPSGHIYFADRTVTIT
jgi:hypothetical protein